MQKISGSSSKICCVHCRKDFLLRGFSSHYQTHNPNPIQNFSGFLDNKYSRLYFRLVSKEDFGEYTEKHHIIPRCLGGDNSRENIIRISARKHFLCHYLLCKMVSKDSDGYAKILMAFWKMRNSSQVQNRYVNSRLFHGVKSEYQQKMSQMCLGKLNRNWGKVWMKNLEENLEIMVKKRKVREYVARGYSRGRLRKT